MKMNLRQMVEKYHFVIFITILITGLLLRVVSLDSRSIRLDESQSIWQAMHSIEYVIEYMSKNVHLPLHNILLHYWIRIFGTSEIWVRMLAVIPGVLSLPAIYLLSREIIDRKSSLLVLFYASISPFWIWYSREIRMYSLLGLLSILSYLFFIRLNKGKHLLFNLAGYTLVTIIGSYTHYFFVFVVLSQIVFLILAIIYNNTARIKHIKTLMMMVIAGFITLLAYLPWLYRLSNSTGIAKFGPDLAKPIPTNIFLSFFEFLFGYQTEFYTANVIASWPLFILMIFLFLVKRRNPFTKYIYLCITGIVLPMLIVYFVSIFYKSMYLTRYLYIVSPLLYIFMIWFIKEAGKVSKYLLTFLLVGLTLVSLYFQYYSVQNPADENYRDAVKFIEENNNPSEDIIVLAPAYTIYPFQYYYQGQSKYLTIPIWNKKKGAVPIVTDERVQEDGTFAAKGHKRIFFLQTSNLLDSDQVKKFYDFNYKKIEKRQFSEYIWVHVYEGY